MSDLLVFCAGAFCGVAVFVFGIWFCQDNLKKGAA